MLFCGFAGNKGIKERISQLIDSGQIPHALLLEGADGSGKKTLARIIASAVLCRGSGEKPCGECPSCKKAESDIHPDIIWIRGSSGVSRSFHVDQVREMRSDAYIAPNESDRKIYILENIQNMSPQAQNSALKILEEPPERVSFIMTCDSRFNLLDTILSRVQTYSLNAVEGEEAAAFLSLRYPDIDMETIREAVSLWGGFIGRAEEVLGDGKSLQVTDQVRKIAKALASSGDLPLLRATGVFDRDRQLFRACLPAFRVVLRDASVLHGGGNICISACVEEAKALSARYGASQLTRMSEAVKECEDGILSNANHSLIITRFCSALRRAAEY